MWPPLEAGLDPGVPPTPELWSPKVAGLDTLPVLELGKPNVTWPVEPVARPLLDLWLRMDPGIPLVFLVLPSMEPVPDPRVLEKPRVPVSFLVASDSSFWFCS